MQGVSLFDSTSEAIFEDKPKVEKSAKSSVLNSGRKSLANTSNMPRIPTTLTKENKSKPNSSSVEENTELQKENASLMKLLGDKKIIDARGAEILKLRLTVRQLQQQNLHLAQSNSQMLAELNSGKDKLKDLQHQLGCTKGLLIAKDLEIEGIRKACTCEINETKKVKVSEHDEMGVCTVAEGDKVQNRNNNGRQKSKSLCPIVRKVEEKVVGDNRRVAARRQSARFKHDEPKSTEDLFDTDEMDVKMQEDDVALSVKKEADIQNKISQESRRSSISRPAREVAKKVQSYKEMSVKVKMRRPE